VRQQRVAETRERIVAAGAELAHSFTSWSWRELTVRAVAERAGVNERTVYRHFSHERDLRDAILARLQEEAGVSVDDLDLGDFSAVTARVLSYLATFPIEPRIVSDPTFAGLDQRRREALTAAVEQRTPAWSDEQRRLVAALLDVFWSVATYERMGAAWRLSEDEITRAISWVIALIESAVADGRGPPRER
jgi:AcrR family transcriptional regulator